MKNYNKKELIEYYDGVFALALRLAEAINDNGVPFITRLKTTSPNTHYSQIPFNKGLAINFNDGYLQFMTPLGELPFGLPSMSSRYDEYATSLKDLLSGALSKEFGISVSIKETLEDGRTYGPIFSITKDGAGNDLPEADLSGMSANSTDNYVGSATAYSAFKKAWEDIEGSLKPREELEVEITDPEYLKRKRISEALNNGDGPSGP